MGTDSRMVLDLAVDPRDSLLAVAMVEPQELASSSVRIYKIGAQAPQACAQLSPDRTAMLQTCAG